MNAFLRSSSIILPFPPIRRLYLLFRKGNDDDPRIESFEAADASNKTQKIRCPICRWSPDRMSRWTCWDCGHPEYFYSGCGTEWNTFDTQGICPTCSHQWIWTTCLSCGTWSLHEDWYVDEEATFDR